MRAPLQDTDSPCAGVRPVIGKVFPRVMKAANSVKCTITLHISHRLEEVRAKAPAGGTHLGDADFQGVNDFRGTVGTIPPLTLRAIGSISGHRSTTPASRTVVSYSDPPHL
jgi:hypothetical protein